MNDAPTVAETGIPMAIPPDLDPLPGVFAFLDASLPEALKKAAVRNDPGVGRLPEMPSKIAFQQSHLSCKAKTPGAEFFMGYVIEGYERQSIAKVLAATFRLQWKGCPVRSSLAKYRLYHSDDMADALAAAYIHLKRGLDPEAALNADYSVPVSSFLRHIDNSEILHNSQNYFWGHFHPFYEDGDRIVEEVGRGAHYYLLVRGDRLVWKTESVHMIPKGVSLRHRAEVTHFEELGGAKAFLNGEFDWPPPDWINPVSDEEEAVSDC